MKEQLISFETAKLAKEKGFKSATSRQYNSKGEHYHPLSIGIQDEEYLKRCPAPTQSLLQIWLWETFTIHVSVIPIKRRRENQIYFQYRIVDFRSEPLYDMEVLFEHQYSNSFREFESPFTCWEEGLQEALKLIP